MAKSFDVIGLAFLPTLNLVSYFRYHFDDSIYRLEISNHEDFDIVQIISIDAEIYSIVSQNRKWH